MRSFSLSLQSIRSGFRRAATLSVEWVRRNRILTAGLGIGLIAVFLFVMPTQAAIDCSGALGTTQCFIYNTFLVILSFIVTMLGTLFTLLVSIFMQISVYNGFGSAQPVTIGWPIVRDICNMFFIVILLVSAFATIIGYPPDFNYKQVLPKLLLMAVLINFSKTLILLAVDLSQVVMLSFANAIRQAGPGNFITAMGITDMLRFNSSTVLPTGQNAGTLATAAGYIPAVALGSAQATAINGAVTNLTQGNIGAAATNAAQVSLAGRAAVALSGIQGSSSLSAGVNSALDFAGLWGAYILSIIMLIIAIGTMLIMILYIIGRIIFLWVALIFSPFAFMASALPGKALSAVGEFTHEYWSKLTKILTGGPIVMFFVWLTLAIVQGTAQANATGGAAAGSSGLAAAIGISSATDPTIGFVNQIGSTNGIASFIVAIVMLLMGIETATTTTGKISKSLGKYAEGIKGATERIASTTARLGAGAALGIGTLGVAPLIASKAGRLERRLDLRGKVAQGLRATPVLGSVSNKLLEEYSKAATGAKEGTTLEGIQLSNRKREKEEAEKQNKFNEQLGRDERGYERWNLQRDMGILGASAMVLEAFGVKNKGTAWLQKNPLFATEAELKSKAESFKFDASEGKYKDRIKELSEQKKASLIKTGVNEKEAGKRAELEATRQANRERAESMAAAEVTTKVLFGRKSEKYAADLAKIGDDRKKDPMLFEKDSDMVDWVKTNKSDEEAMKKLPKETVRDGRFQSALLEGLGIVKFTDTGEIDKFDVGKANDALLKYEGTELGENLGRMVSVIKNSEFQPVNANGQPTGPKTYVANSGGTNKTLNRSGISDLMVQKEKGKSYSRAYDNANAMNPVLSASEVTARANILQASNNAANIEDALINNTLPIDEVIDLLKDNNVNTDSFMDVTSTNIAQEIQNVANQNTASGVAGATKFFTNVGKRVGELDYKYQVQIHAKAANAGAAQTLGAKYELLSPAGTKSLEGYIKSLKSLVTQIDKKRSSGGVVSPDEQQVENYFNDLGKSFPEEDIVDPATKAVVKRGAPALAKYFKK